MNLASSIAFLLIVGALSLMEHRFFKTLYTPFNVTAWPLAIISFLVNTIAVQVDFLPVTIRTNLFLLANVFLIWVVGIMFGVMYLGILPDDKPDRSKLFSEFYPFKRWLIFFELLIVIIAFLRIYLILAKNGWWYIATDWFEKDFSVGPVAHLIQFGKALLIIHILGVWGKRKSILDWLAIALMIVVIVALRIKYHIFWVFIIVYFIKTFHLKSKVQLQKIKNIFVAAVLIFSVNYLIMFWVFTEFSLTNQGMWEFITRSFFNYFFSGPIVLDKWLDLSYTKPWWTPFLVFINLKNTILGIPEIIDSVDVVSAGFTQIAPKAYSNVGTSFGVYFMIGGIPFSLLTSLLMGVVSYTAFVQSILKESIFWLYINVVFLTMGALSFFVQYFTLLSTYEMSVFFIIILIIMRSIKIIR